MKEKFFVYSALILVGSTIFLTSCKKSLPEEPFKTMVVVTKSTFGSGYNNAWFLPAYLLRDGRVLLTCGVDTSSFVDGDGDGLPASSVSVSTCAGVITEGSITYSYTITGDLTLEDEDDGTPGNGKILIEDESSVQLNILVGSDTVKLNLDFTPSGSGGSGWYFSTYDNLVSTEVSLQKNRGSNGLNLDISFDSVKVKFSSSDSGSFLTPRSGSIEIFFKGSVSNVQRNGEDGAYTGGDFTVSVATDGEASVDSNGVPSSGKVSITADGDETTKDLGDVHGI